MIEKRGEGFRWIAATLKPGLASFPGKREFNNLLKTLDSRIRGNDRNLSFGTFYDFINRLAGK